MNKVYVMITLCCVPLLYACEKKDALNKPNTEARTMIIGGVPVHDKDYHLHERLLADDIALER